MLHTDRRQLKYYDAATWVVKDIMISCELSCTDAQGNAGPW